MIQYIFSWTTLYWILMPIYLIACLGLIVFVLLQKGKGGGFAGAFGGGGTEAVFGPRSSHSLPQRITYTMAGIFMVLSLVLSMLSGKATRGTAPALVVEGAEFATSIDRLFDPNAAPLESDAQTDAAAPVTVVETAPVVIDGGATPVKAAAGDTADTAADADPAAEAPAEAAATEDNPADAADTAPADEEAPAAS